MLVGFTGIAGFLLRLTGPLTIAPTITLVGLALFNVAEEHTGISISNIRTVSNAFFLLTVTIDLHRFNDVGITRICMV